MRAAPAFQVSLQRFGVWRGAVLLLATLGVAAVTAWLMWREPPLTSPGSLCVALAALGLAVFGAASARVQTADLRWDGRVWHLGLASGDPVGGDLTVAIDLGPWMLLRFSPAAPEARPRTTWLPAQRRGLELQWHALRCAVYSPRPAPAEDTPVAF
ncbi:MAG: hypothetical protein ABI781_04875 [Burkholderiales bacterium]